jgi:hypothetical protein
VTPLPLSVQVWAIFELTDVPAPDAEAKLLRFGGFLRALLATTSDPVVQRLASRAVGHLVAVGGSSTADFAEAEVRRALDWLVPAQQDAASSVASRVPVPTEARKYSAVLLVRQLSEAAPLHFAPHFSVFFARIWSALSDPSQMIREAAAASLASALSLLSTRHSRAREQFCMSMFNTARAALASGGIDSMLRGGGGGGGGGGNASAAAGASKWADSIHGALLVLQELLVAASSAGVSKDASTAFQLSSTTSFLTPHFNDICGEECFLN